MQGFSFCSCVCVVQSESKWEGAVSRLQWYRVTPASYNACNSSSSNSPSEAHNRIDEWRRIRRAATQSSFMFLGEGLRPLVTNEKRLTLVLRCILLVAGTLLRSPDRIHRPWSCSETTGRTIYNFPTPSRAGIDDGTHVELLRSAGGGDVVRGIIQLFFTGIERQPSGLLSLIAVPCNTWFFISSIVIGWGY